jgi:hypothetical protein
MEQLAGAALAASLTLEGSAESMESKAVGHGSSLQKPNYPITSNKA